MITFKDTVDAKQTEELYNSIQEIISEFRRGFKVLSDLSFIKSMNIDAHLSLEKLMELFNLYEVSQVIRIIPDSNKDVGFNIMSAINYSSSVKVFTYQSTEEALKSIFLKGSISSPAIK